MLHGVEIIAAQKADVILFTGDLVNDLAEEMNDYIDVFSRLQAPMGVFSTLGNHDYGDYYQWPDRDEAHILKEKPQIIALGYDQKAYVAELKKDLKNKGILIKIIRLKPYKEHIYKNHLLKK